MLNRGVIDVTDGDGSCYSALCKHDVSRLIDSTVLGWWERKTLIWAGGIDGILFNLSEFGKSAKRKGV